MIHTCLQCGKDHPPEKNCDPADKAGAMEFVFAILITIFAALALTFLPLEGDTAGAPVAAYVEGQ